MTKYRAVRAAHAQAQSNAAAGANGAVSLDAAGLSLGTPTHSNAAYSPADYSASNTPSWSDASTEDVPFGFRIDIRRLKSRLKQVENEKFA